MGATRKVASYGYVALLSGGVALLDLVPQVQNSPRSDQIAQVGYLVVAIVLLSSVDIRMERGHLNLSGLAIGVAAIMFSPLHAPIVGVAPTLAHWRLGPRVLRGN